MKNLFILITIIICSNCSDKYDAILEGLSKNYVLLSYEMEKDLYMEYFKLSEEKHLIDLKEYNKAVSAFYDANKDILNYLFTYEKDTSKICRWIKTKNPYSSNIGESDLLTNAEGALILIDNYLTNSSTIRIPTYANKLTYEKLKLFYEENKNQSKVELKDEYKKFVSKIR